MRDLRKAAQDALKDMIDMRDTVLSWSAYASEYFQKKHDLAGNIKLIDEQIEALRAALAQPDDAKQRLLEIMRRNGLATGHGDTIDDALKELDWQLSELMGKSDGT